MKQIKDPVHGYISVPEDIVEHIIDTKDFQRLRHLKQLSATFMVYPAANHSRFEHSLGVYHLGKEVFENLINQPGFSDGIEEPDKVERTLQCACLLHDIGHPPFSHIGEKLLDKEELIDRLEDLGLDDRIESANIRTGLNPDHPFEDASEHELMSCIITLEKYAEVLRDALNEPVDPCEVCAYILGFSLTAEEDEVWQTSVTSDLLHSAMDIDRLDYIVRDNFMTGASVTNVDTERMIDAYTTCDDSLVFSDKALSTIGNYLEGRVAVYLWVTQHHKSVYANALLRELIIELDQLMGEEENKDLITIENILQDRIHDSYILYKLREYSDEFPESRLARLYYRFEGRDFVNSCWKHKVAYQNLIDDRAQDEFYESVDSNPEYVQAELISELDCGDQNELWVELSYVPNYQPSELRDIRVSYEGDARRVTEFGLYEEREFHGPVPYVFAPEEYEDEIINIINQHF